MKFDDFLNAISSNKIKLVKQYLSNESFNPADQYNLAFIYACLNGHIEIINLLLNDKRVNPADQNNSAFISACKYEDIKIVKLLLNLNDKRINPADKNNIAFISACYNRNIDILKLFVEYNFYSFDFKFEDNDKFYFLKIIYLTLKEDIEKYLIGIGKKELIIELKKSLISNKVSNF